MPSARSSARSMHDSYTPMDSPIPGERQVFLRPSEQEFVQGSYPNGGLPPLPEFPAYNGNAMQSGTSNPLYGEESAADEVAEPESDPSQAFSQSYAAPADYQHANDQYSQQHPSAHAQPTVTDYTAAAETQLGLDYPVQGAADRGIVDGDYSHERYSADQSHNLEQHTEDVYSQSVPSMLTVPRQSSESVSGSGHARQLSTYDAPSQHDGVSGQAASRSWSARSTAEQPAGASHSARSTADIASPSPVTPGGIDNIHSFDHPGHPSFTPAYPPASRSQAGAVSQTGRPQSASSVQPVSRQTSSGRSSEHPVQYMQPAPVHAVYEEDDYQEPAARGGYPGSSRGGYQQPEEDYRGQHAARSSRPGSARTRQSGQRGGSQGQPPRPYSPAQGANHTQLAYLQQHQIFVLSNYAAVLTSWGCLQQKEFDKVSMLLILAIVAHVCPNPLQGRCLSVRQQQVRAQAGMKCIVSSMWPADAQHACSMVITIQKQMTCHQIEHALFAADGHYDGELASGSIPAYHPPEPTHASPRSPRSRPGSAMVSLA